MADEGVKQGDEGVKPHISIGLILLVVAGCGSTKEGGGISVLGETAEKDPDAAWNPRSAKPSDGPWKQAFWSGRPSRSDKDYELEYEFGEPASDEQIAVAERELGAALPDELREMLKEFNGVSVTGRVDRERGYKSESRYLNVEEIPGVVDMLLDTESDFLPPTEQLRKVVFFWQANGHSTLAGICLDEVAGHSAGTVVRFDYELDELQNVAPDLMSFVQDQNW